MTGKLEGEAAERFVWKSLYDAALAVIDARDSNEAKDPQEGPGAALPRDRALAALAAGDWTVRRERGKNGTLEFSIDCDGMFVVAVSARSLDPNRTIWTEEELDQLSEQPPEKPPPGFVPTP